ncbi:MAG: phosphatidylserine/phosphatidylglycerophosphate/cardiolipin synthase family protein [Candidatus Gracilibacteria bacterium]|nr:phosphatidylserine/phosphatidylglycerophosphate/cardiolipin synthase family protein [Candidatus Gracilibacteria bacterium]
MNKNKVISSLIIINFLIIFSLFNFREYYNFHKEKIEISKNESENKKYLKDFNLNNINSYENIEIYETPDKKLLENLVEKINNAEKYVYIEVYMLTETRIRESLIKAKKRGIDIKVIMEKDPYLAYSINNKTYDEFQKNNIDVVWSNTKNYSLNHTKLILIDGLNIISTGNLTYSTFTQNRDFFVFIKDNDLNEKLIGIFKDDFTGIKKTIYDKNLVVSPSISREKILKLLDSANNDVKIYMQYFSDDEINNKLIEIRKKKKINISAVIPKTAVDDENTKILIKNGINIKEIPKYKMHAKTILIDEKYLLIGSINFSNYSIDKNREIGIIIENRKIISKFLDIFKNDFN